MSRHFTVFAVGCALAALCAAQGLGVIGGQVLDPAGSPVADVAITLTNVGTHNASQVASDSSGNFKFMGLAAGTYSLRASKPGFESYEHSLALQPGQTLAAPVALSLSAVQQSVVVNGGSVLGATAQPSQNDVFLSDQTERVIDRTQMDMLGPIAGAAQVIALAPGALVTGYGSTGATKYTISINGLNQGWGGYGGYTGGASLGITFDGIPVVDPATGLWQSATIPQMQLVQDTVVTYGPGNPADRWYTNVGGSVEFTPLQPGNQLHGDLLLSYGSYNQKNAEFDISSPVWKGWSTILAGGGGMGDDFRNGPDGFGSPSKDLAIYSKTLKSFHQNTIDFGGYYVHSGGYRAQVIPTTAVPGVTLDGTPAGAVYSQQSSGFYSTLPYAAYNKYDVNVMGILHARENIHIDDSTQFQNLTWFTHIRRLHDRLGDVYNPGPQLYEWNNPHTDTYGDQGSLTKNFYMNTVTAGGYFIHALYNTRNNFYNPADGGSYNTANIGGKIRSGDFNQNDGAVFLQDNFHPTSSLTITPGIRWVSYSTSYFNNSLQDFNFAPGVILNTQCPVTLAATPGNTKDQGSSCANFQRRNGFEPSVSASYRPLRYMTLYGGYLETLRSPSLGGGGGLFQSVDPNSYHLSRVRYGQFGFKIHTEGKGGVLNNLIYGADLFRETYSSQEIDIGLANGSSIAANGAARYQGLNYFLDDDPAPKLHVFMNGNVEGAHYTNYVVSGLAYNGSPVPYVPSSTFNLGATYSFKLFHGVTVIPVGAFQFVGTQHIFDNSLGAPSNLTMSSYGTLNLGLTAPFKHFDLLLNALNVLNKQYNEYLYVSSGGYFGTSFGGYELAYPAAPFTVYGSVRLHF